MSGTLFKHSPTSLFQPARLQSEQDFNFIYKFGFHQHKECNMLADFFYFCGMKKIIRYNPALSGAENAFKNGVSEDAVRYYIKSHHIDRRKEAAVRIINAWTSATIRLLCCYHLTTIASKTATFTPFRAIFAHFTATFQKFYWQ